MTAVRRAFAAAALLWLLAPFVPQPVHAACTAPCTKAQITTDINTNWPDNTSAAITPAILRSTVLELVNSYIDANGSSSLACSAHQWMAGIATLSSINCAQPAFTDISGTLAVNQGGTGATTALGAQTNLGLAIGTNVEAWDADLDCLAALATTGVIQRTGAGTCAALSNISLTALINIATASLSGALPAWPNNTTTFFRGDGTYSGVGAGALTGQVSVPNGGTGLASGQSGGVFCFNSTTTALSSTALTANGVVVGGGAGACPGAITAGSNGQLLLGVTSGAPQMATMSQDGTISNAGVLTVTKTNNVAFGTAATAAIATCAQLAAATAGMVAGTANVYCAETTTTFGATTTFDFSTFINTAVTLTGNITTQTLSNVKAGQAGTVTFIQDGTGSRTTVWNSIFKFAGGVTPTLSTAASAIDVLSYSCRSASICVASLIKDVR